MEALKELQKVISGNANFLTDPTCQVQLLQYFERLKSDPAGLSACAQALTTNSVRDIHLRFLCLQIVESGLKSSGWHHDASVRSSLQNLMLYWLESVTCETDVPPVYFRNKGAQIFALVFIALFPYQWPTFFQEVFLGNLQNNINNVNFVDFYLRTLLSIDSEVADREIQRTKEDEERNGRIKDAMREKAITDLVESWHAILSLYSKECGKMTSLCLNVIGAYVSWIDLLLIANDKFVPIIVACLSHEETNESAGDCLCSLISKGMEPTSHVDLISAIDAVLESSQYYNITNEAEEDVWMTLAEILNCMGVNLIDCSNKLQSLGDTTRRNKCLELIEKRLGLVLISLSHESVDVSGCVTQMCHQYVSFLKQFKPLDSTKKKFIMDVLLICFQKYKFPQDYNHAVEGETEAEFVEYRKEIRIILMNIGLLDKDEALNVCCELVSNTLNKWQTSSVGDIELALNIAHFAGELFTTTQFAAGDKGTDKIKELLSQIVSSGVSNHKHMAVMLQYFEVVSRYDKLLAQDTTLLPPVVVSFLDDRGLHHSSPKVRSRVAYLFSRFVRGLKMNLQNYVEQILMHLEDLLAVLPAGAGAGGQLTPQDQLFLFEATGLLIVNANFTAEKKKEYMEKLLNTLVVRYEEGISALDRVVQGEDKKALVEFLNNVMAYASRTTKAFSNQLSMKACMCSHIYVHFMLAFLNGISSDRGELLDGLRQYLHRMVICLEEELLSVVPLIMQKFLSCLTDRKCLYDFLVLVQQIMQKHRVVCIEALSSEFAHLMTSLWNALSSPFDPSDEINSREHTYLRRGYFSFLLACVNSLCTPLWTIDASLLPRILSSIVDGAYVMDPLCQKSCMSIIKRLCELDGCEWFLPFLRSQAVSLCIHMPLQQNFDFEDAQTILALVEDILALKIILQLFVKKNLVSEFEMAVKEGCRSAEIDETNTSQLINCLQQGDNKAAIAQIKLWFKTIVKQKRS